MDWRAVVAGAVVLITATALYILANIPRTVAPAAAPGPFAVPTLIIHRCRRLAHRAGFGDLHLRF
jgi:hypothetical protein